MAERKCFMKKRKNSRYISIFMAASLLLTSNSASASIDLTEKDSGTGDTLNVLSRVIESNNNGLLRYSYIDSNGKKYNLKTASNSKSSNLRKAGRLPSKYDLREHNLETSIKDQGVTGSCWAFAAIKASESNSILKNLSDAGNTDFSESHLVWYSYNGSKDTSSAMYGDNITQVSGSGTIKPFFPFLGNSSSSTDTYAYDIGGNVLTAINTLAQWSGAETEEKAPFNASTMQEEYDMADSMKAAGDLLRYDSVVHLQNAECYDNASRAQIKQALIEHGAIDISMYYDACGFETYTLGGKSFYQTRYSGELAKSMANHCVTLVGWDDNYSRNNFANKPSGNGAWLIANSYGGKYNDGGYFWMSYYEPSICDIFTFDVEPADNYDNNYQYDGIGYGDTVYINNTKMRGANVFKADSAQSLKAVSFYTLTDNQAYNIKIYKNLSGSSPVNGTLVEECTVNGTAKLSGYHTIQLPSACTLKPGEKFSVVVTYKYNSSTGNQAYMPIEGKTETTNGVKYSYSSKKGQSYYYLNKKWNDLSAEGYNNICIKAFTDDLNKSSVPSAAPAVTQVPAATETPGVSAAPDTSNVPGTDITPSASSVPDTGTTPVTSNMPVETPVITPLPSEATAPLPSASGIPWTTKVKISKDLITLGRNESYKLDVSLTSPLADMSLDDIRYTSNNNKIAVVDSTGVVTAKSVGVVFITASIDNGEPASIKVNIKKAPSKVNLISSARKKLKKGNTFKISAKVPDGCASYHFKYSSSNKKIAKVNSKGKVTALKKGKAIITVKTYNNKKASIVVIVR